MIVVDASAIIAILTAESESALLVAALDQAGGATTTPIAIYEATLGVRRKRRSGVTQAERAVMEFLRLARIVVQPIQPETAHLALEAFDRYGKGRGHPARLNLGDCFMYAQAKAGGASLLYKGDDFSKTDIASAS
ncbi:MAG: type II toxin-antitoxin system VapC family toxin [Roseiarcus sp.]